MSITGNLKRIQDSIPDNVKLVAVSKTHPEEAIIEAYNAGHRIFGESKVQDVSEKAEHLPNDISWHFIGHLQSNKVKQIVPFVGLIHGVDSYKLLQVIDNEAKKINRKVNCLLQVHISEEITKFGFLEDELYFLLSSDEFKALTNINICGLMGIATFTDDKNKIRSEFRNLKRIFEYVKSNYFTDNDDFNELSMGMSDDYDIAIEEGSSMIRVGSSIFGVRNYNKN